MRNLLIVAEVAMLACCLALVWFGSRTLKAEKAPEAGKILTEAVALTEEVDEAIREADALRAAGDIELVYQTVDRQYNAGIKWNTMRLKLDRLLTPDQLQEIDGIDIVNDPGGSRAILAEFNRRLNNRATPISALVLAGVLILAVMVLERRRKRAADSINEPGPAGAI